MIGSYDSRVIILDGLVDNTAAFAHAQTIGSLDTVLHALREMKYN